jgi:hypothetical protein
VDLSGRLSDLFDQAFRCPCDGWGRGSRQEAIEGGTSTGEANGEAAASRAHRLG